MSLLRKYNNTLGWFQEKLKAADVDSSFTTYINDSLDSDTLITLMEGQYCCHTDLLYEKLSANGNEVITDTPFSGLKIHGDPCFYFKVKIEGEWGAASGDNDGSIDFTVNPIYIQFLTRATDIGVWAFERSTEFNYSSGTTIIFSDEFIFESDTDLYVSPNISTVDNETLTTFVKPIANYALFHIKITVTKCTKTSWWTRLTIPQSDLDGVSIKQGYLPNTGGYLPFKGYYECHVRIRVIEEITSGGDDGTLTSSQTFELRNGNSGTWYELDRSGRFVPETPDETARMMNYSLQGSIFIYIDSDTLSSRKLEYRVNLPNGSLKQLVEGYCHVHYKGQNEGILRSRPKALL
jgi:hypothetical protein